jgi:hypothetical protein
MLTKPARAAFEGERSPSASCDIGETNDALVNPKKRFHIDSVQSFMNGFAHVHQGIRFREKHAGPMTGAQADLGEIMEKNVSKR